MDKVRTRIGGMGNLMFKEAYIYAQFRDGNIPDIFVQDEKYFEKYKDELKKRFGDGIGYLPYIAMHVRRGDYVDHPFYVDLFKDGYYQRAMKEFPLYAKESFMIFSNDIEWCRKQEEFKGCSFSEFHDEVGDFNLMASCTGHIIANSTYSWWAAYIAPHTQKIVAPLKWHPDGVERTKLPANWIRV